MIRRAFTNSLGLSFSLLSLTACGLFDKSSQDKDKTYDSGYVTNARLEAQRMALLQPEIRQGMALYENCEVLAADLNESVKQRWIQQRASISDSIASMLIPNKDIVTGREEATTDAAAPSSAPSSAPEAAGNSTGSTDTLTNVQEAGVDEADRYRIGRDQIYAHSFGQIQIINRTTLQLQGSLDVSAWYSPQFFTKNDRLIVVGQTVRDPNESGNGKVIPGSTEPAAPADASMPFPGYGYGGKVKIAVYQTAVGQLPVLLSESFVEGTYLDSRLVQNQLVLVVSDQVAMETVPVTLEDFADEEWASDKRAQEYFASYWGKTSRDSAVKTDGQNLNGVPCQNFVKRKMTDWDTGISKVLTLDTVNPKTAAQNLGVIGQGGEIYMTTDSLYLLKTQVKWFEERWGGPVWIGSVDEKVLIQQIGFDGATGALNPLADGEVRGRIKDRWALHGMNGGKNLVIATSTGFMWSNGGNEAQNHLYILEQDTAAQRLNVIGSVENFGTNEDIRSVRYVGNTAYVVTFRQTDPLFAFDITDPKAPAMLSGLKIPGFSTYMHPLASGRLLGVGFDAFTTGQVQGVQVSLFDTSDPTLMSRLDAKAYGSRGSNSDINHDHHAFFFDSASGLIGIPLVELFDYGSIKFTGAQLLFFDGNTLVDRGRVSHRELIPSYCQNQMAYGGRSLDINRLYRVDDRLITLSAYGMKAYTLTDFTAPTATVTFKSPVGECQASYPMPF
ncbi:MAG TPA: beta-propeller domain-containing protein [Oligoflexus sp.]|uniref:beta-propeller domain-containing protein n=1 Tax=Oligoflexus sp. TaxID=1971216 RepID=UPI002D63774B|nr:beta-propeller domain-containing protein [Oligoflexus sp.]HYX33600.1 beta-propeller domain-containing protein [Oligoflexus sp.]